MSWFSILGLIFLCIIAALIIYGRICENKRARLTRQKKKAEDLARLENYFKKWPELWRLYEYAKQSGYDFEIQSAEEAILALRAGKVQWRAVYPKFFQKKSKTKPAEMEIVVPLDILESSEIRRKCDYALVLAGFTKMFMNMLERLTNELKIDKQLFSGIFSIALDAANEVATDEEESSKKDNLLCLSHEIGHLKLAEELAAFKEIIANCPIARAAENFLGCLFKELNATLKGLEILEELGLAEFVGREFALDHGRETSCSQCDYCWPAVKDASCPLRQELEELLDKFKPTSD